MNTEEALSPRRQSIATRRDKAACPYYRTPPEDKWARCALRRQNSSAVCPTTFSPIKGPGADIRFQLTSPSSVKKCSGWSTIGVTLSRSSSSQSIESLESVMFEDGPSVSRTAVDTPPCVDSAFESAWKNCLAPKKARSSQVFSCAPRLLSL